MDILPGVIVEAARRYGQQPHRYIKELPEGCVPITEYKGVKFDKYWYHPDTHQIIMAPTYNYKYVNMCTRNSCYSFMMIDVDGKRRTYAHGKFVEHMKKCGH